MRCAAADPAVRLTWAAAPLKPATLATTRLAEHWAHGLDVTGPLGVPFPDTDRLRHVAWLAHGSLPYAFGLVGEEPREVRVDLAGPDGAAWGFGPATADSRIQGDAGAFCRVGARRLAPDDVGAGHRGPVRRRRAAGAPQLRRLTHRARGRVAERVSARSVPRW